MEDQEVSAATQAALERTELDLLRRSSESLKVGLSPVVLQHVDSEIAEADAKKASREGTTIPRKQHRHPLRRLRSTGMSPRTSTSCSIPSYPTPAER